MRRTYTHTSRWPEQDARLWRGWLSSSRPCVKGALWNRWRRGSNVPATYGIEELGCFSNFKNRYYARGYDISIFHILSGIDKR